MMEQLKNPKTLATVMKFMQEGQRIGPEKSDKKKSDPSSGK